MKDSFNRFAGLTVAAVFCLASSAFGQPTLQFMGGTTGSGDGVGLSPYQMGLNTGSGPVTVAMDCDDWADNISTSTPPWIVTETDLSVIAGESSDNGNVYYGSDPGPVPYGGNGPADQMTLSQSQKYTAAAYLAIELSTSNNDTLDLSLALWDIFNPLSGADGGLGKNIDQGVENDLSAALAATAAVAANGLPGGLLDGYDVMIYTPTNCVSGGVCETPNSGPSPQEFIGLTAVPEPSTWAFLGFDFAGAGLVGLYFLRRKSAVRS